MDIVDDFTKAYDAVTEAFDHHRDMVGKPGEAVARRDLEEALKAYWEVADKIPSVDV